MPNFDFVSFFSRACPPGSGPDAVLEYLSQVCCAIPSDRVLGSTVRQILNVHQQEV